MMPMPLSGHIDAMLYPTPWLWPWRLLRREARHNCACHGRGGRRRCSKLWCWHHRRFSWSTVDEKISFSTTIGIRNQQLMKNIMAISDIEYNERHENID